MVSSNPRRDAGLEEAFGVFSQVSEQLASSYQALETRVAQLTVELAQARSERVQEQGKNGRLANRIDHLLSVLPAGIVVLDGHGRVQECNPAAVELLGEPLSGAIWTDIIARAFLPRAHDGHEISLRDGRLVSVATRSLDPEPGQIILITDLTSTRQLQEQLARHQRLSSLGEMAASLAHQVRTPLATALLYVSHLNRPQLDESERLRVAEKILSRLRHLEHLVKDMLVFARGDALRHETVALAPLLIELQQALEPQLQTSGCHLTLDAHVGDAALLGNREALAGALLNLVTNAIQACGTGGEIRLAAACTADGKIEIRVHDNGPGIPAELQEQIFEPFFTTRADGTGLGLAVVQAVTQAHGGMVWLESQPGKGTMFGLRLPLYQSEGRKSQVVSRKETGMQLTDDLRPTTNDSAEPKQ
jgi:two-component system sensor histidine kinase FlrB